MFNSPVNTTSAPLAPYDPPQHQSTHSNSDRLALDQVTDALNDCHRVINDQRNAFQRLIAEGRKIIAQKIIQNEELQFEVKVLQAENAALLEQQAKEQLQRTMGARSDNSNDNSIGMNKNLLRLGEMVMSVMGVSTMSGSAPLATSTATTTTTQEGSPPIDIEDIERQFKKQQYENEQTRSDLVETEMQLSMAEERLTECLNHNDTLMREVESLKKKLYYATEENNAMKQQLQRQQTMSGTAGDIARLIFENQELQKAFDKLKIDFNCHKALTDSLQQNQEHELKSKEREIQAARNELSELGEKYASLESEHGKVNMEHVIMESELAEAKEEAKKMKEELAKAEEEARTLKQNLEEAQQYMNKYYVPITDNNQTVDAYNQQAASAYGHYDYSNQYITNYQQYGQYQ